MKYRLNVVFYIIDRQTPVQVLEKAYRINGVDYDDWAYRLEKTR